MPSDPSQPSAEALPLPPPERIQELLFDAARLGRVDVIAALIHAGADVTARDGGGHTPLILSCYHGHETAALLLLEHGAPVDQPDGKRGNTALMGAAFKGFAGVAGRLLQAGADPHATNHAGQTALMFAALFDRSAIVDELLACGADPDGVDAAGNSAVSVALAQGNGPMAERLIARQRKAA